MRLADFIRVEIESIVQDWEELARTILHATHMDKAGLRDHARDMLLAIAEDLDSRQDDSEQAANSNSHGREVEGRSWAEVHGGGRFPSGFSVMEIVSEYRALRKSVVSQWVKAYPSISRQQADELCHFHEAVDQAVAESLEYRATTNEMETRLLGAISVAEPDPIFVLDLEGRIAYANPATVDLFAHSTDAIIGRTAYELGFSFAEEFQNNLKSVIADKSNHRGDLVHKSESGRCDRFEYLLAPVLDCSQTTESVVCIVRDVTERSPGEEKIWHNAHHDLLTGLPNRQLFMDRLGQEVKHAKRSGLPVALLFLDLDGFKEVNDSLGPDAGDLVLCDVAKRLAGCVRKDDTVARLGGDEFVVILTGSNQRADVEFIAQTIIDTVEMPFEIAKPSVNISVSIGVSFYPEDATVPYALMDAADQAMYSAKESGPNGLCFHGVGNG